MTAIPVEERRKWVGASEVAGLLGCSPWTTAFQLYHEKRGSLPRADLDGAERVEAGRFLEPAIGRWAAFKWAWEIENVRAYIPHPTVEQFGCSLDFATIDGGDPVEIKNVDRSVFREKWESEGEELLSAPAEYLVQVQAQLACTGKARGWIVACVGGNQLFRMEVERHDALIARMEKAVTDFWRRVRAGDEPPVDFGSDLEALSALYGASARPVVDLTASNELPAACAGYLKETAAARDAKKRADVWKAEILAAVGDAAGGITTGFEIKMTDIAEAAIAPSVRRAYRRMSIKET